MLSLCTDTDPDELEPDCQDAQEWLAVGAEFPDYDLSSGGSFRTWKHRGRASHLRRATPVLLARHINKRNGYDYVELTDKNGRVRSLRANRLVCAAFKGPPPTPKHDAAHLDGDRQNNSATNLAWKTRKENMADKLRHGTQPFGERCHSAKLTKAQAIAIYTSTELAKVVAERYGISKANVYDIRYRRNWAWATEGLVRTIRPMRKRTKSAA